MRCQVHTCYTVHAKCVASCVERQHATRRIAWWWQVDISITPGGHASEDAVNKQLNDKERVAAALENPNLLNMVNNCLGAAAAG